MTFKKLDKHAKEPVRSTQHSAGLDVFSNETVIIDPHETVIIPTGLAMTTEDGEDGSEWFVAMHIRSSLAVKGLQLANGVAVIDKDYKDEIKVIMYNSTNEMVIVEKGKKIAQMIVMAHYSYVAKGVTFKYDTRIGGLGSTNQDKDK